jgi:hypothetical protein
MDRQIVYPGAIPLETDLLNTNRNTLLAIGKLCGALFGSGGVVNGLAVSPTSPASLSVQVGEGEIYQLANVDNSPYSSLPADENDQIVKQGVLLQSNAPSLLSCPAPTTAGYSINYLIEATLLESDTNQTLLPYYNASNPTQAYAGPNNNGQSQATTRSDQVALVAKPGAGAITGSQVTPGADAGYVPLAVVTVAYGQTQITAPNIAKAAGSTALPADLLHLFQQNAANYTTDSGAANAYVATYTPAIAALTDGIMLSFQAAHSNTGASTLNVNGLGAKSIIGGAHAPLQGGEIIAGGKIEVMWHAGLSSFVLLEQTGGAVQVPNATQSQQAMPLGQATGRWLRTSVYTNVAGVQYVSVNGGTPVTAGASTFTALAATSTVIVEVVGAGGAGGGSIACTSSQISLAAGGGAGAYGKTLLTAGFSGQAVTVGAAGAAVSGGNGGNGGTSSFGAFVSAPGGSGGSAGTASSTFPGIYGYGNGSSVAVGGTLINASGANGDTAFAISATSGISGSGGASAFGGGGNASANTSTAGNAGISPGSGGSGAATIASGSAQMGGNGAPGICIVWEYA